MQRSGAAAILMQKSFKDVEFLYPKEFNLNSFIQKTTLEPFSDESIEYLNALSKELNKDRRVRDYPDVATFAFFCRKANIYALCRKHSSQEGGLYFISPHPMYLLILHTPYCVECWQGIST